MHEYTPADIPDLPAGWEIYFYQGGNYNTLSLWRVQAFLNPYKENRDEKNVFVYSCGRFEDSYLPEEYSQEEFAEAIQELVWKATELDATIDLYETLSHLHPLATNRPSRSEYFAKSLYKRRY